MMMLVMTLCFLFPVSASAKVYEDEKVLIPGFACHEHLLIFIDLCRCEGAHGRRILVYQK